MLAKVPQKNLRKYLNRIEYAEQKRDAVWKDKWLRWYKRYRNYADQLKDAKGKLIRDRSNISIPYAFTMVETVLPRLVETLFAGRPYVTVKGIPSGSVGKTREDLKQMLAASEKPWETAAKNMETLVDYQQNVPMDIQDVFKGGLKGMTIYGTAVAYTGWSLKEKIVTRKELQPVMSGQYAEDGSKLPLTEADGTPVEDWQPVQVNVKEYDDPEAKFLDLGIFFVDPNGTNIDNARYCGHDCFHSKSELQEMEKQDLIKVDWKKIAKESQTNEARNYRMTSVGLPSVSDQESISQDDDLYRLTYYWEDDLRVVILNRTQIVAEGENPYWHGKKPYDKDVYSEVPDEFYGIGVMEITEDLQDELNVERNQRIDYRSMSLRRMWKVRNGANISEKDLVWRHNGMIKVGAPDDVSVVEAPDSALAGSFNQEQTIKQDMKDAVGAHDIVMGAGGGKTATETMATDNNASIRFKMIISSVEKRLLLGITRKMVAMNQQFIEDVRMLPIFDKPDAQWPIISPEEIQGEFHYIPAGSSVEPMANKEAFKQRMVELYNIVSKDTFMQQFPAKRRNLLKKVLESFDMKDTDDILPTDEELAGVIQQQAVREWLAKLPPDIQQLIGMALQGGAAPAPGAPPSGSPPADGMMPPNGAENTAAMQEQGLQMTGAGV